MASASGMVVGMFKRRNPGALDSSGPTSSCPFDTRQCTWSAEGGSGQQCCCVTLSLCMETGHTKWLGRPASRMPCAKPTAAALASSD